MLHSPKTLVSAATALIMLAAGCNPQNLGLSTETPGPTRNSTQISPASMQVGNQKLTVDMARTVAEHTRGLSGRPSLPPNHGMLFDFTTSLDKQPSFWMKDMLMPLDIIWIYKNQVIAIDKNVPPPPPGTANSQLPLYSPPSVIDYVLEVNSGWSDAHSIKVGDQVIYPK